MSKDSTESDRLDPQFAAFATELKRLRMDLGEQLRRLRTDHNALCACLDSIGILPADVLEQELNRQNGRRRSKDISSKQGTTRQVRSTSSSALSERLQANDSPRTNLLQSRAPQPTLLSDEVARPALGKTFPTVERLDSTPSHPSKEYGTADARRNAAASQRSRSREQEGVAPVAMLDLYDLAHPCLFPNVRPAVKAKALEDVRKAITNGKRPDVWRGPDTPLLGALEAGCRELVQLLILCRANPNVQNEKGASVLHRSVFRGEIDYAVLFLEAQADPNLGDQHDQTPIFFAPTTHICELLCRKTADTNIVNLKGQSALHLAALANLGEVLVWLSQHVSRQLLDMKDNDGNSAEDYAKREGMKAEVIRRMKPYDPHHPARRTPISRSKRPPLKKSMSRQIRRSTRSSEATERVDDVDEQIEDAGDRDEAGYIEAEDDENVATIKFGAEEDRSVEQEGDSNDASENQEEENGIEAEAQLVAPERQADPTKNLTTSKKTKGFGITGLFRSSKPGRKDEQ